MKKPNIVKCERCKKEEHQIEPCYTCAKKVCHNCTKSSRLSRKIQKGQRLVICKTCWSTPSKRTKYHAN